MSESQDAEEIDLAVLAKRLVIEGMPVQMVIASEAGVSQPTVSRAIRGQIKQPSKGALKLWKYAITRMVILHEQGAIGDVRVARGHPVPKENSPSGAMGQQGARAEPRKRSAPFPRRRSESVGTPLSTEDRRQLAETAIAGLRDYLDDAFDPQLVIEQLAVLRRAQDPARRHRGTSDAG